MLLGYNCMAQTATKVSDLTFASAVAGVPATQTILYSDERAASFSINGTVGSKWQARVVQSSVNMIYGSYAVTVNNFVVSPSSGTFDGRSPTVRVGATATIESGDNYGGVTYSGTPTFEVVYVK